MPRSYSTHGSAAGNHIGSGSPKEYRFLEIPVNLSEDKMFSHGILKKVFLDEIVSRKWDVHSSLLIKKLTVKQ